MILAEVDVREVPVPLLRYLHHIAMITDENARGEGEGGDGRKEMGGGERGREEEEEGVTSTI